MTNKRPLKIFFSGIGGSGVSAIASFMADKGHTVVGSDRAFDQNPDHPVCGALRSKGITIVPQDGAGIDRSFDLAVFSTAVEPDRPEVIRAKSLGIPTKTRPEFLSEIVTTFRTLAVAGTSGKSTTSGMLAFLMERLGMEPNFIGGGRVKQFRTETNPGNSITGNSDHLVIEACESDGTIVTYQPRHSIILNLDLDHHPVDETAAMFSALMRNTSGMIVVDNDDRNLGGIAPASRGVVSFSIEAPADYRATDILYRPFSTEFSLRAHGGIPTRFTLSLPGRCNLSNALACIALLSEMGIPLEEIAQTLPGFAGIERRFDIRLNDGKRLVIDDYAHNPQKISALMAAMDRISERICYIFQPHGFGPVRMMKAEYIDSFVTNLRDCDHLILLPIFYAGGAVSRDVSSHDLAEGIRAGGGSVEVIRDRETVLKRTGEWDSYVIFGARDESLSLFAGEIAASLMRRS